jgi:hypothetical protein
VNLRVTLLTVIIAAWVGVGIFYVVKNAPGGDGPTPLDLPYFYTVEPDDIVGIEIETPLGATKFLENTTWYFEDPGTIPVSHNRFGGMTFLLGGPKIQRALSDETSDPAIYGLDIPAVVIGLTLKDSNTITFELGGQTPDGVGQYSRIAGYPDLVLVDSTWGEVLERLVAEPPLPDWFYQLDSADITELLFFDGLEVVRGIGFHDEDGWVECDLPVGEAIPCLGSRSIDAEALQPWLDHLASPAFLGVAKVARDQTQVEPSEYGIDGAPYVDIRVERVSPQGFTEVSHVTMAIGDVAADGESRYIRTMEQLDIALTDLAWTDKVLDLFVNQSFVNSN